MRKEGWETRLNDYIQGVAEKSFEWGDCDCLLFAADAALIASGVDVLSYKLEGDPETIRGLYTDEKEARSLIRKYRRSMQNIMDVHFNKINPNFAQRGDIVITKLKTLTFGVVWGGKALFKMEGAGFLSLPLSECKYAWRVE